MSIDSVTAHPRPISPTTAPDGIRASSKNTSLNAASPVACRSGRIVIPLASIGTANIVSPRCLGTAASVRAMHMPNAARSADDVHTFWPCSDHSSPSSVARSWAAATSLPALGSLNSWHHLSSAAQHRADVAAPLLLRAVLQQHGHAHADRDREHPGGQARPGSLLVQRLLVLSGQALPAVLDGDGDPGEAGVEQPALEGRARGPVVGELFDRLGEETPGPGPERQQSPAGSWWPTPQPAGSISSTDIRSSAPVPPSSGRARCGGPACRSRSAGASRRSPPPGGPGSRRARPGSDRGGPARAAGRDGGRRRLDDGAQRLAPLVVGHADDTAVGDAG